MKNKVENANGANADDGVDKNANDAKFVRLAQITRSFASILALCAPRFADGSNAAKIVSLATNVDAVIDSIRNG